MGPLDFIGDKLKQFGSDIANGTTDAFDAATHALGDVFGSSTPSATATAPKAPAQAPAPSQSPSIGNLPINNPLAAQDQQPQQQQQNPLLKMNFGQNQNQAQQAPQNTPAQLNTKLVNFSNPTIKTQPLSGAFGQTPQTQPNANQNSGGIASFMQGPEALGKGIAQGTAKIGGIGVEDVRALTGLATGNQPAAQAAIQRGGQDIGTLVQGLQSIPRAGVQIAKSFNPNQAPFTPQGSTTALLGKQPITSLQQTYRQAGGGAKGAGTAVAAGLGDVLALGSTVAPIAKGVSLAKGMELSKVADPDINDAITKIQKTVPEPATPTKITTPEQESLNATEGRATATKEVDTQPTAYQLRKGIGVTPDMITDDDRVKASYSSATPEYIAGQRIVASRNVEAETAAQNVLENGGTRKDAVQAYQDAHPGITKKDATFRVSRVARESNVPLRPNERSVNPEGDQHALPRAEPGDYERAEINKSIVDNTADSLAKKANQSLTDLSQADRDNFVDYLEKTKPIEEADDAGKVQQAIQDSLKLTDTGNALDHEVGGGTPHVENYFPGYTMRDDPETIARDQAQAEQDIEEEVGPKEWNNMSLDSRREAIAQRLAGEEKQQYDDENFGGYKNQKREFATRAERRAAKVNDEYDDPRDALTRYANGLKYKIGNDAFAKGAQEADIDNLVAGGRYKPITITRGKNTANLSEKGYNALKNNDIAAGGGIVSKINRGVKQSLISLGAPHAVIIPQRFGGAEAFLKASTAINSNLADIAKDSADLTKVGDKPTDPEIAEFGARVGSPIHSNRINAGVSDTSKVKATLGSKYNPLTVPKRVVYNWLLPSLHTTLLKALKENLDARNIDYDSPLARSMGKQVNDVMGYSKRTNGAFEQSTFAPSLIKSTANIYAKSLTPEGTIARGGVAGQQLFNQALGFISKAVSNQISQAQGQPQNKSKDNFWSTVLHSELGKPIYTPFRKGTSKGNPGEQIDLGVPGQYQEDLLKLALNLKRNKGGQLGVGLNTPAQIATNIAQTGKNIASPVASAALSAATNQTYNGQQIRNPYASLLTQAEQTGINTVSNALPINLQGFVNQNLANHLPDGLKSSVQLNNTGPTALRIGGNALGMNPSADTTTGQGPAVQKYYSGITKGQDYVAANSNNPTTQATNETAFQQYYSRAKNNSGQTILLGPQASKANAALLASNPTVLAGVQVAEKANGKGNYNPIWDLPANKLQAYMTYESLPDGDPNRTVMEQKDPWLLQAFGQEQTYFNSISNTSKAVPGQGYVPYPNITPAQNQLMSQVTQLASVQNRTPAQETQLESLENNPALQSGYTLLDQYTNSRRQSEGLQPIPYPSQSLTPQQSALLTQEAALPSGTGAKSALIKANQADWNQIQTILGQDTIYNVEKYGGVIQQGGTEPDFLKDTYEAGTEDIAKTTTAGGGTQYSLNPVLAYAQGSGSGSGSSSSSSSNPLVPMPKIKRQKQPKMKKPPHLKGFRAPHIKKQGRVKVQSNGQLKPVQVAKPTAVVKLAH